MQEPHVLPASSEGKTTQLNVMDSVCRFRLRLEVVSLPTCTQLQCMRRNRIWKQQKKMQLTFQILSLRSLESSRFSITKSNFLIVPRIHFLVSLRVQIHRPLGTGTSVRYSQWFCMEAWKCLLIVNNSLTPKCTHVILEITHKV